MTKSYVVLNNSEKNQQRGRFSPPATHQAPITSLPCLCAGFVSCVNQHHLVVNYVHDVKDILQVYELSTGTLVRDLPLDVGTVAGVSCKKKHSDFFYKFTSFTTPGKSGLSQSLLSFSGVKLIKLSLLVYLLSECQFMFLFCLCNYTRF